MAQKIPRLEQEQPETPLLPYSLMELQKMNLAELTNILSDLGYHGKKKVSKRELVSKIGWQL